MTHLTRSRLVVLLLLVMAAAVAALMLPGQSRNEGIRKPPPVCGPLCLGGGIGVGGR